jgi:putative transposase
VPCGMTMPRRVLAGATYALTRRCLDRRFYMKPSRELNQIYMYALALAQQKYGMRVHAFVAMSNHLHEIVSDPDGVLPDFMRDLRREVALGAKQLYRIPANVWAAEKPTAVELHGGGTDCQKVLYTLLNPVKAGLVARAAEWPGAISRPGVREIEVRRPKLWFDDGRPDVLTLTITPPPSWEGTEEGWHTWLAGELTSNEDKIGRDRARHELAVLGKRLILDQSPFARPRNADDLVPGRNPAIATGGDGALMKAVIYALRAWRRAYREALGCWRVDKTTLFPLGTWWVVERAGASLA